MLEVHGLAKSYGSGARLFEALDFRCAAGEIVAILGESGSGKSTLLNVVAGLDRPDAGTVLVDGAPLDFSNDDALAKWRRKSVGFVFQAFHLLPYLSASENVALPLALNGVPAGERTARAAAALEAVGLEHRIDARPGTLSGGEAQRVAIARALVHAPRLLLADEPTGNLDEENAGRVLEILRDRVKASKAAALVVTHSPRAAAIADRVLRLAGQRLVGA